jgi:MOSC domain-containing protein YiiM
MKRPMLVVSEVDVRHLTADELQAGFDALAPSPKNVGALELIVRRPRSGEREVVQTGELDPAEGLVGDNWSTRGSPRTPDGQPNPDCQLNIMNARVMALVAGDRSHWPLAGDQLFVDFDLSADNVPAGTRLVIGSAVVEVTPPPHTGCAKFVQRFGVEAMKFVNSETGRRLHLRGINAKVVHRGVIRVGDVVNKHPKS